MKGKDLLRYGVSHLVNFVSRNDGAGVARHFARLDHVPPLPKLGSKAHLKAIPL